jgi:zona occludens toxin
MSITIHHGPNGSFKTSGVMQDYFIPAAKAGRIVVTNIRGVSRERTLKEMPEIPESFDVIFVDTEKTDGRALLATWWHWVPHGALLLFDEAGVMFPKRWTQSDLSKLAYPGTVLEDGTELDSVDSAAAVDRPCYWNEAWEMHRHYNWDVVLSAPNIKLLREDVRSTTEGAYKHRNKALLGPMFKGYKEGYHSAATNGSMSDLEVIKDKRIGKLAFSLYDSTKTGIFSSTLNGFNAFTHPKILFFMGLAVSAFAYALYAGGGKQPWELGSSATPPIATQTPAGTVKTAKKSDDLDLKSRFDSFASVPPSRVSGRKSTINGPVEHPFQGFNARITGYAYQPKSNKYYYQVTVFDEDQSIAFTNTDLEEYGYRIRPDSSCRMKLRYKLHSFNINCFSVAL